MTIYTDIEGRIKDVNTSSDPTLIPQEITDGTFDGWTTAKICCYKVTVNDGNVTMMTPYVDSRLIDHIDQLGQEIISITPYKVTKTAYISDEDVTFTDVPNGNMTIFCPVPYEVEKISDRVTICFEPLTEVTDITIMIQ